MTTVSNLRGPQIRTLDSDSDSAIAMSPETLGKLQAKYAAAERKGINWDFGGLPKGVNFTRVEVARDNFPDGFTTSALVAGKDPNNAKTFYLERTGGFAGLHQIAGPFSLQDSADPIRDAFRAARRDDSEGGELVTRRELFDAVRAAYNPDKRLTADEKKTLAMQWASLFDGAQFHATEEAQRAYSRLQEALDLPVFPIF